MTRTRDPPRSPRYREASCEEADAVESRFFATEETDTGGILGTPGETHTPTLRAGFSEETRLPGVPGRTDDGCCCFPGLAAAIPLGPVWNIGAPTFALLAETLRTSTPPSRVSGAGLRQRNDLRNPGSLHRHRRQRPKSTPHCQNLRPFPSSGIATCELGVPSGSRLKRPGPREENTMHGIMPL